MKNFYFMFCCTSLVLIKTSTMDQISHLFSYQHTRAWTLQQIVGPLTLKQIEQLDNLDKKELNTLLDKENEGKELSLNEYERLKFLMKVYQNKKN